MFLKFTDPDGDETFYIDPFKVGAVMSYDLEEKCTTIAVSGALITVAGTPEEVLERIKDAVVEMPL